MSAREFMKSLPNGTVDILQLLLSILESTGADYCLIGGLAVNVYVEPVVSLDIAIVLPFRIRKPSGRQPNRRGCRPTYSHTASL